MDLFCITLSAALMALSYAPWGYSSFAWVSLVPWLFTIEKNTLKTVFVQSLLLSMLYTYFCFWWSVIVLHDFIKFSWLVSVLGFSIYSIVSQIQFVAFSFVFKKIRTDSINVFFAVFYGATSYTFFDSIFPHFYKETLGQSQYLNLDIVQMAEYFGVKGITFLVVAVNVFLFFIIKSFLNRKYKYAWGYLAVVFLLLFAIEKQGESSINIWSDVINHSHKKKISVIQANISSTDKVNAEKGSQEVIHSVLSKYFQMTKVAETHDFNPDVIVWPETAHPEVFDGSPMAVNDFKKIVNFKDSLKKPLFFGGYKKEEGRLFNSYFFLDGLSSERVYRKTILVPFVEYFPGLTDAAEIRNYIPQIYGLSSGDSIQAYEVDHVKYGPMICYEGLYSELARTLSKLDAQVLLNVSNVSWFNPFYVAEQHLSNVIFRAIETRLPVLVATNTGIGALITPVGEMLNRGSANEAQVLNYEVPIVQDKGLTFFTHYGETWIVLLSFFAFIIFNRDHILMRKK